MLTKKWRRTPPNPTPEYEFMGPPGTLAMLVLMPMLTYGLYFNCRPGFGCVPFEWDRSDGLWPSVDSFNLLQIPSNLWGFFLSTWDLDAFLVYSGFIAYLIICYFVIPGPIIDGTVVAGVGGTPLTKDRTKYRLKYKLNAFRTLMVTLTIVSVTLATKGVQPFLFLYDHFLGLLTASMVWTFALSAFLYLWSFLPDSTGQSKILAHPGNTGNHLYDFVMGRELNPRFSASPDSIFDLKYFAELRPGLIGWVLVNISMACQQYQVLDNGRVTNSMVLVLVFETFYVMDALWNEASILTTMDITTEGFGFMLADAHCSWVPLNYSLQARFLAMFPLEMELWHVLLVVATQTVGYYIFRSANTQKDTFRRFGVNDPRNKGLKYLETGAGSKLLINGWWGTARHINYMGDWMMALAWSLPCGFNTPIPYYYPIYFAILLIHREIRDEHNCRKKYGKDWERYCELTEPETEDASNTAKENPDIGAVPH
ncbi:erg24, C-14 sterol reductase [Mortierella polycephala]|uniref:Delta(14)-sterol reductase n=1 Tax=Mortierella polycephala TaxID=41804 RepID=A0A9P6U714_9FUNG|nr:erg24, C-14 sterol reductase [Mortierella polycephala]